jgi:serpin B
MTVEEYLATLTGEGLHSMLANPVHTTVYTKLPAFETEYKRDLLGILGDMGYPVSSTFNGVGISTGGPVGISRVIHKTYITVGPQGTKAGAATVIEMTDGMAEIEGEPKRVTLDRPFVYLLIDTETNLPFFIGTVKSV